MALRSRVGFLLTAIVLTGLAAVVVWLVSSNQPFVLTVLYDDIGELKQDDPVVWRTFTVGKVEAIEPLVDNKIGVRIRLKDEYAPRITHGTRFVLRRAGLLGMIGTNGIELVTPETPGAPFTSGEKVAGVAPRLESLLAEGTRVATDYWRRLSDEASLAMEEFKSSPHGQEILQTLQDLQTLAGEGLRQAGEGLTRFGKDHEKDVDTLLRKLETIRDELKKMGDQRGAERVQRHIDQFRSRP
jgi:ABC-type transporter Mla subunit MlaD